MQTAAPSTIYIAPPLRSLSRVVAKVIAVLLLVWAGWWGLKHVMWLTPDGRGIATVVRNAISVNETLLTPPQAYQNVRITPAEMGSLSQRAQRKLADYYVGRSLLNWRDTARRSLNAKDLHWGKTSAWMSLWHVNWIHLSELTLFPSGSTATASASAEFQSGDAINRLDFTYHLIRTTAGWRIDRDESNFQPDWGP